MQSSRNLEMGGAPEPCPLSVVVSSCRRRESVPVVWLAVLEVWGTRYSLREEGCFSGVLVALSPLEDGIAQEKVPEVFSL